VNDRYNNDALLLRCAIIVKITMVYFSKIIFTFKALKSKNLEYIKQTKQQARNKGQRVPEQKLHLYTHVGMVTQMITRK